MKLTLTYTIEPYGSMRGVPSIEVAPGNGKNYSLEKLKEAVNDAFVRFNMQFKYVVIDVRSFDVTEKELGDFVQFIDWLITQRIKVAYNVDGMIRPSYLRMGGLVRVFIYGHDWLGYPTHEIYWAPEEGAEGLVDEVIKPTLDDNEQVPRYIIIHKEFPLMRAIEWLSCTDTLWVLHIPMVTNVREVL